MSKNYYSVDRSSASLGVPNPIHKIKAFYRKNGGINYYYSAFLCRPVSIDYIKSMVPTTYRVYGKGRDITKEFQYENGINS